MPASDLLFLHCGSYPNCAARVEKQFDSYYTLQFLEQGGGAVDVWYDNNRSTLDSKSGAWFWPAFPGPHIRFHAAEGCPSWRHRYAAFQGPRVARWMAEGIWPTTPQQMPPGDYGERFDALLFLLKGATPDPWRSARAANLLEAFLLELAEARATDTAGVSESPSWLTAVLAALTTESSLDYARLAAEMGMAVSTLRRRFRAVTGIPLHEFVLSQRLAKARALLGETDLPIKSVAEKLGYQDVYFFTRQFRLRTGVTPAAYRRSRQG